MATHWWRFLPRAGQHPVVGELERLLDAEAKVMRDLRSIQVQIAEQEAAVAALTRASWTREEVLVAQARYAVDLVERAAKEQEEES